MRAQPIVAAVTFAGFLQCFGQTGFTGAASTYGLEGDPPFRDESGLDLSTGSVIQIGYFAGVPTSMDVTLFTEAEWNTFVPLTGDGSLNPIMDNRVGDGGAPAGYWAVLNNFNTDDHTGITAAELGASQVRLGVRVFNGPTVVDSTHFNTVTSNDDGDLGEGNWLMSAAAAPPNTPSNANANLDLGINNGSLSWQSGSFGSFETSLSTSLPLQITRIEPGESSNEYVLNYQGRIGVVYDLETSTTLTELGWTSLSSLPTFNLKGNTVTVTTGGPDGMRFWRLRVQP